MVDTLGDMIQHGNDVTRWHTMSTLRPQNLAGHSWGVAMLISRLFDGHPSDELLLIKTALEHDLAEKHIGDMPRIGRTDEHQDLEIEVSAYNGIRHEDSLPEHLKPWLQWADLIEAGLHAKREFLLGNTHYHEVRLRVADILTRVQNKVPAPLFAFAEKEDLML